MRDVFQFFTVVAPMLWGEIKGAVEIGAKVRHVVAGIACQGFHLDKSFMHLHPV